MSTHTDINVTMMREFIQSIDMDRFLRKEMETTSSLNNTDSSMWLKDSIVDQPGQREIHAAYSNAHYRIDEFLNYKSKKIWMASAVH